MANMTQEFQEKSWDERIDYWMQYVFKGLIEKGTGGMKNHLETAIMRETEMAYERGQKSVDLE